MARDLKSRRRRALAATFANVLDEDTLLQELWILQDSLRSDAVGDIIELVDGVARRHMLDPGSCKRLYTELFKALRLPEEALPLDPWPAMQAARAAAEPPRPAYAGLPPMAGPAGAGWPPADPYGGAPAGMTPPGYGAPAGYPGAAAYPAPPGYPPGYAPPGWPGAAWPPGGPGPAAAGGWPAAPGGMLPGGAMPGGPLPPAMAGGPGTGTDEPPVPLDPFARTDLPNADAISPPPPAPAPAAPEPALEPEPPLVFAALMRAVIAEVQRFHREALDEIGSDAIRQLAGSAAPPALREAFARAWERPAASDWALPGRVDDLADLVKVVHRALEMAFGRTGADQILQRGVATAGALPEAQRLSPMRLLASM